MQLKLHPLGEVRKMNFKKVLVITCLVGTVAVASAKLPQNSYITRPTPTKEAFLKLIQTDTVVMDRYMRHFAMTRDEVTSYFGTLHMGKIAEGGLYTVYNVPKSTGVLRSRLLKLKKGEKVWMDQYNQPIMVVVCGNPMTRGPRNPVATSSTEVEVVEDSSSAVRPTDEGLVGDSTPSPIGQENLSIANEPALAQAIEATKTTEGWQADRNLGILAAAIPFIAVNRGGGKTPPPVPEPATIVALTAGAGAVIARRRKK